MLVLVLLVIWIKLKILAKNIDFCIANIDKGVGIVKPSKNYEYKINNELSNLRFDVFFKNYYRTLPIVSSEEALKFISS